MQTTFLNGGGQEEISGLEIEQTIPHQTKLFCREFV